MFHYYYYRVSMLASNDKQVTLSLLYLSATGHSQQLLFTNSVYMLIDVSVRSIVAGSLVATLSPRRFIQVKLISLTQSRARALFSRTTRRRQRATYGYYNFRQSLVSGAVNIARLRKRGEPQSRSVTISPFVESGRKDRWK